MHKEGFIVSQNLQFFNVFCYVIIYQSTGYLLIISQMNWTFKLPSIVTTYLKPFQLTADVKCPNYQVRIWWVCIKLACVGSESILTYSNA